MYGCFYHKLRLKFNKKKLGFNAEISKSSFNPKLIINFPTQHQIKYIKIYLKLM